MRHLLPFAMALVFSSAALPAEIALHASAIDSALKKELFKDDGKYLLSGKPGACSHAFLESPSSSLRGGRLFIRAQFSGSAGAQVGEKCLGTRDSFWVTLSGQPKFSDDSLILDDVRVDEAKDLYRPLLERLLKNSMRKAISLNLREELSKALSSDKPYKMSLSQLKIQEVVSDNDVLRVKFDFSIEAR